MLPAGKLTVIAVATRLSCPRRFLAGLAVFRAASKASLYTRQPLRNGAVANCTAERDNHPIFSSHAPNDAYGILDWSSLPSESGSGIGLKARYKPENIYASPFRPDNLLNDVDQQEGTEALTDAVLRMTASAKNAAFKI